MCTYTYVHILHTCKYVCMYLHILEIELIRKSIQKSYCTILILLIVASNEMPVPRIQTRIRGKKAMYVDT
jgi:predicted ABC-type ATPase